MGRKAALFITILIAASAPGRIITVDDDGPADFNNIQAAIDDANDGDTVEIQPGTYIGMGKTGRGNLGWGNIYTDFLGKVITVTSTDPTDPNIVAQAIIAGRAFIFQSGEDATSVLAGLTITGGNPGISIAGSAPTIRNCTITGGDPGISIAGSAPTIRNCTMTDNRDRAIYCEGAAGLNVTNCLFADNSADIGGAAYFIESSGAITNCVFRNNFTTSGTAGAIRMRESRLTIADCIFEGNFAEGSCGAINNAQGSELILNRCLFVGNSVPRDGGGSIIVVGPGGGALCSWESNATISNCLFVGNAARDGGAIFSTGSDSNIVNCTFTDNFAREGTALYCDWYSGYGPSNVQVRDSIMWDGEDCIAYQYGSVVMIAFSDIPGFWPGYGNIDSDPCFADPGHWLDSRSRDPNLAVAEPNNEYAFWVNGDYHVKSQAGRYDPNTQMWVQDGVTSVCIDAGDPNGPLGPEPFPNGGLRNMGAYGSSMEASKSYFGKVVCETIVAGDINGDCIVNGLDFSLMAAHWLGGYRKTYPTLATDPYVDYGGSDLAYRLRWTAGSGAVSHDVYFGSDHTAMRYADRDSSEYKGNQTERTFYTTDLLAMIAYYWRIDEVGLNGETMTGQIWTFTTGGRPR